MIGSVSIVAGASVAVAPTDTVIFQATTTFSKPSLYLAVRNDDATQTVTARVQSAPTSSGPWMDLPNSVLADVAAFATADDVFDVAGRLWIRGVSTASGAGGNTTVWAELSIVRALPF